MGSLLPYRPRTATATQSTPKSPQRYSRNMVRCTSSSAGATMSPMAVKRKEDETVVFSWVTWPSRKLRDEGMKKVMSDPRLQPDRNPMPFDGKRLIYGGFEVLID